MFGTMVLGHTAALNRTKTFQAAVCVLNSLQTNTAAPEWLHGRQQNPGQQLQAMKGFLQRAGITVDKLDQLNMVHVTGTKGKGSTCAFTESILRSHGFRTGFYSSPHLLHVTERIRIDGRPISKELFNRYFWEAYQRLEDTKDGHHGAMPLYFQFLTLLAFHVFLQERVDVAVVEVGIGGQYDCTNIIRRPWACGVASLGLDHCGLLGDALEDIAWQKAGIFKPGVPAFTVTQRPEAMAVLRRRAEEIKCPLVVCPELDQYEGAAGSVRLGLAGEHQRLNASLGLQLSVCWLHRRGGRSQTGPGPDQLGPAQSDRPQAVLLRPSAAMLEGLQRTEWLGRSQTVRRGDVTYYLDGAHTSDSMAACVSWFTRETQRSAHAQVKVLLFNTTGERDAAALLTWLQPCSFDYALFCPNIPDSPAQLSLTHQMLTRCTQNQNIWQSLNAPQLWRPLEEAAAAPVSRSLVFPCILSALQWIGSRARAVRTPPGGVSVLVTGSLYLVGGALKHLEPSLDSQ